MMIEKHKTVIMREMLKSQNFTNIADISLHSSDASDIISDEEKNLESLGIQID